jgi:glycosyltransferase involved in cell wall biosynthesis
MRAQRPPARGPGIRPAGPPDRVERDQPTRGDGQNGNYAPFGSSDEGRCRRLPRVLNNRRVAVVMPAYNAAATLSRTVAELDLGVVDEVVLVDDASTDSTLALARELGLDAIRHDRNRGYGGNQKTCYGRALELGADIIVMVHPDYQYSPLLVPAMASMIAYGEYDMILGSRILAQHSVARGMPVYKYVANRVLTLVENVLLAQKLSEYHTGLRAFSSALLAGLPFERNSDDFVFDNQIIAQAVAAGARIGEVSCPTRYQEDASSINLPRSVRYGLGVLRTSAEYRLSRMGWRRYPYLDFDHTAVQVELPSAKKDAAPEPTDTRQD